jgi:hypothetical protein
VLPTGSITEGTHEFLKALGAEENYYVVTDSNDEIAEVGGFDIDSFLDKYTQELRDGEFESQMSRDDILSLFGKFQAFSGVNEEGAFVLSPDQVGGFTANMLPPETVELLRSKLGRDIDDMENLNSLITEIIGNDTEVGREERALALMLEIDDQLGSMPDSRREAMKILTILQYVEELSPELYNAYNEAMSNLDTDPDISIGILIEAIGGIHPSWYSHPIINLILLLYLGGLASPWVVNGFDRARNRNFGVGT